MKKTVLASIALLTSLGLCNNAKAITVLNYEDFSTTSGLVLNGTAHTTGNVLRLTDAQAWSMGSAFSTTPVNVTNFSANFKFQYTGTGHEYGSADGIVFVIKNAASGTGIDGGAMGYLGIPKSVGVEFDNWYNPEYGDPGFLHNHIGINSNGSVNSIAIKDIYPTEFNGTGVWYAWVDYNGTTMSVSANNTGVKPATAMLSQIVNIPALVGSTNGLVGFTAATGAAMQNHDILSLNYSTNSMQPVPEPSAVMLTGIGGALVAAKLRKKRAESEVA
jgi:hypothetical protein